MSGKFGGNMKIKSVNDGPVTILIDTKIKRYLQIYFYSCSSHLPG